MAENKGGFRDENGDSSDWIEIFNPTSAGIDVTGWFLSDDNANLAKWPIPAHAPLPPGGRLLVFASDKDRRNPLGEFHTNFKLSKGGESLYLSRNVGQVVVEVDQHINFGAQRTNASAGWGLNQDTGLVSKLRFFIEPTPTLVNAPSSCAGFSDPPTIDTDGGIFTGGSFAVNLNSLQGHPIFYTVDGSNPDGNSTPAGAPITIDSTTILRAVAVQPGCIPSPTIARSYIFVDDVLGTTGGGDHQVRPAGYPQWERDTVNGVRQREDLDYAMDPLVIASHRATMVNELTAIPTVSISLPVDHVFGHNNGIYSNSGDTDNSDTDPLGNEWQRVASFEFIDPSTPNSYVQENCEIKISGNSSRALATTQKHNLRLTFKEKLTLEGNDKLEFRVPPYSVFGVILFKQLQLRNPTQDSWAVRNNIPPRDRATFIRDAWARNLHSAMNPSDAPNAANPDPSGNLVAHRRWVHLYIDGLHWGLYDMSERVDEDFTRTYGDPDANYDVLKSGDAFDTVEVADGDIAAWDQLIAFCTAAASAPAGSSEWADVEALLDVDNYIDYMIVCLYMYVEDWPNNNWFAIRRKAEGAKFKFLVWDNEFSMSPGLINNINNANVEVARPFSLLTGNPDFQDAFKARVALHFQTPETAIDPGGVFSLKLDGTTYSASQLFQDTMDEFQLGIFTEAARWGDSNKMPTAYTFSDPSYLPGQIFGDWQRATDYYRDTYIPQRRDGFLSYLQAIDLAD